MEYCQKNEIYQDFEVGKGLNKAIVNEIPCWFSSLPYLIFMILL